MIKWYFSLSVVLIENSAMSVIAVSDSCCCIRGCFGEGGLRTASLVSD